MNILKSFKSKLIFIFVLVISILSFFLTFIAIGTIKKSNLEIFKLVSLSAFKSVKPFVDADKMVELSKTLDSEDPYYKETCKEFMKLRDIYDCIFVYSMVHLHDNEFMYICDGTPPDDAKFSALGDIEDISSYGEAPHRCMETKEIVSSKMEYQDRWGRMCTIYSPLITSDGKAVGFVAYDFPVEDLLRVINGNGLLMVAIAIVFFIIGIVLMLIPLLLFFKKMDNVVNTMKSISSGAKDLTSRIPVLGGTELGVLAQSCNSVIENLQEMIIMLNRASDSLVNNSHDSFSQVDEMLDTIKDADLDVKRIKFQANEQSNLMGALDSELSDFNGSIELLNGKINLQVDSVEKSVVSIKRIVKIVKEMSEKIDLITNEYGVIVKTNNESRQVQHAMTVQIDEIAEQAKTLSEANEVIKQISSQTNLLAMNAAIEAAHAGKAGEGFAVVAQEIRNLAETSAKQTNSIKALVKNISATIGMVVESSNVCETSFANLDEKINYLSDSMKEIKSGIGNQNEMANSTLGMMNILSNSAEEINHAGSEMNKNAETIMARLEQVWDSSDKIVEGTEVTSGSLSNITHFAHKSVENSKNNECLAQEIRSLLNSYKVE